MKPMGINGYLTIKEWSSKNGINLETAQAYARLGKIESIKVKGHRYISKDTILSVRPYSKRAGRSVKRVDRIS